MITFKQFLIERAADDLTGPDESSFLREINSMITRAKATNQKAADLFDIMQKHPDTFWEWLENEVVPVWDKYEYPSVGTREWGQFQDEFRKTFIVDDREPQDDWDIR